jgi:hypothetical protein
MMNETRLYYRDLEQAKDLMDRFYFDYALVNGLTGQLVMRKMLDLTIVDATISYLPRENTILVWLDDNKQDLYSGIMPAKIVDGNWLDLTVWVRKMISDWVW